MSPPRRTRAAFGVPPPALTLLWVSASCTVALCLAISFTFPRTLWGGGGSSVRPQTRPHSPPLPRPWPALARGSVVAPRPPRAGPSCRPPHLQPGLHLVQHGHVQDVDLGLQHLHGLLGTGSRVRGDGAAPAAAPPQCCGHGRGDGDPACPPRPAGLTTRLVPFSPTSSGFCGEETASGGAGGGGQESGGAGAPPAPHLALGLEPHRRLQLCQALLQLRHLRAGGGEGGGEASGPPRGGQARLPAPPRSPWRSGQSAPAPAASTARR